MRAYTLDERREIAARINAMGPTLDGKPAQVMGVRLAFALVRSDDLSTECEYAWSTLARVGTPGGLSPAFRTGR